VLSSSTLMLRTIYIDDSVDRALAVRSESTRRSKATVFRRLLADGMRAVREGRRSRVPMSAPSAPLALKRVGMSPKVDQLLRVQAFDEHLPQNEVLRQYLNIGLEVSKGS
jgi:hypothetical protein